MKQLLQNKRASTMQGWTEGIGMMVLFVLIFGIVIVGMNTLYTEDYNVEGLDTDAYEKALTDYGKSQDEKLYGGEVDFESNNPISLKTSWDIITGTLTLVWSFITGAWINTILVNYLKLGQTGVIISTILRGLLFVAIGFIVLRIIFRVKT